MGRGRGEVGRGSCRHPVPSRHAAAGEGWWEFISLREHWHQKRDSFLLVFTDDIPISPSTFYLINAISPTGRCLSQNIKMQN